MTEKITGIVTGEDEVNLELEIETKTGPKLVLVEKKAYEHLKTGDMFIVELIKL